MKKNDITKQVHNYFSKAADVSSSATTTQTNLLNQRDEMLSSLSQLKYLLTLS